MSERTQVALLRGINVGGHNKVPMADLRDVAVSLDFDDPVTYIQSGNLVFDSDLDEQAAVIALESALEEQLGFAIPVIVRSGFELAAVVDAHPFVSPESDPRLAMVAFLDRVPTVDIDRAIEAKDFGPDRFSLVGREVFLEYPNGSGRSKLNHALLEQRLRVRVTIRNMNTLSKLIDMSKR